MRTPLFTANRRFDPDDGDGWTNFIAWSGLTQLREVVSLDNMLCAGVFDGLRDEDWQHNVQADFMLEFFYDLPYVLSRTAGIERVNVLAVTLRPRPEDLAWSDPAFTFEGFDLLEESGGVSTSLNCGGKDDRMVPATPTCDCPFS